MASGNTRRMPKTATATPTVRKICCQNRLMRCRIVAFTTALSNEIDTSSTISTAVSSSAVVPPYRAPASRPNTATTTDTPKIRSIMWVERLLRRRCSQSSPAHSRFCSRAEPTHDLGAGRDPTRGRHRDGRCRPALLVELAVSRMNAAVGSEQQIDIEQRVARSEHAFSGDTVCDFAHCSALAQPLGHPIELASLEGRPPAAFRGPERLFSDEAVRQLSRSHHRIAEQVGRVAHLVRELRIAHPRHMRPDVVERNGCRQITR